jgi:phosphoribosylanthranilate isomerase
VKVCGITSVEDALLAARHGADAVGMVFWEPSPRSVGLDLAREICRCLPPFVLRVGVFVDAARSELFEAAEAGLDLLQLHGQEPPGIFAELPRRAIKAVGVGEGFRVDEALRYEGRAAGILLDARPPGPAPGGTGRTFDWSVARQVRDGASYLLLAGGLHAGNVAEAITRVRPDVVDVASGVESAPGRKDPEEVRAFIEAARAASARGE